MTESDPMEWMKRHLEQGRLTDVNADSQFCKLVMKLSGARFLKTLRHCDVNRGGPPAFRLTQRRRRMLFGPSCWSVMTIVAIRLGYHSGR